MLEIGVNDNAKPYSQKGMYLELQFDLSSYDGDLEIRRYRYLGDISIEEAVLQASLLMYFADKLNEKYCDDKLDESLWYDMSDATNDSENKLYFDAFVFFGGQCDFLENYSVVSYDNNVATYQHDSVGYKINDYMKGTEWIDTFLKKFDKER